MSADKYAQFIAEQQRKLSVSGTNTVNLHEGAKPEVSVDRGGVAHVKDASGKVVASYSKKEHGADFMKKANTHMAKLNTVGRMSSSLFKSLKKEDVEQVDEKKELSPKQKKIAAQAGDPDKIEGEDFAKLRAQKEEVEIDEARERSPDYLATIHKDDPEYDKKIGELKKGHKLRIRGRLGKDNPNAPKYRQGGPKYRSSSLDVDPKDSARVDVYTRGARKKPVKEEISLEEQTYIEEMVGKGKLPSILQHHKDNMLHHQKMAAHHAMMADKSESVGDTRGFDHHTEQGMEHDYQAQHHGARYDHAASLGMKAKALKQVKAAKMQMDIANKALATAKADKRDY